MISHCSSNIHLAGSLPQPEEEKEKKKKERKTLEVHAYEFFIYKINQM